MTSQHDVLRSKWKLFRNEINDHWSELSSDDIDRLDGRRDNLVILLKRRYKYARRRAEREVDRIIAEFEDRLRKAS